MLDALFGHIQQISSNVESYREAWSSPPNFFPPHGGSVRGAPDVAARYDQDAKLLAPGGSTKLEVIQSAVDGDVALWTDFRGPK